MGRLKGENIEFFAKHRESFESAYRTQIYFCFDTKQHGDAAFTMLKNTYASECNYNAYGSDKRDFYLGFTSESTRDWVLEDIEDSLSAYQKDHGNDPVSSLIESSDDAGASDPESDGGDTSTYIIIGAAAAIIILLLIWQRKK